MKMNMLLIATLAGLVAVTCAQVEGLTDKHKREIIDEFKEKNESGFDGGFGNGRPEWDENLAKIAENWVSQCNFEHPMGPRENNNMGGITFYTTRKNIGTTQALKTAVRVCKFPNIPDTDIDYPCPTKNISSAYLGNVSNTDLGDQDFDFGNFSNIDLGDQDFDFGNFSETDLGGNDFEDDSLLDLIYNRTNALKNETNGGPPRAAMTKCGHRCHLESFKGSKTVRIGCGVAKCPRAGKMMVHCKILGLFSIDKKPEGLPHFLAKLISKDSEKNSSETSESSESGGDSEENSSEYSKRSGDSEENSSEYIESGGDSEEDSSEYSKRSGDSEENSSEYSETGGDSEESLSEAAKLLQMLTLLLSALG